MGEETVRAAIETMRATIETARMQRLIFERYNSGRCITCGNPLIIHAVALGHILCLRCRNVIDGWCTECDREPMPPARYGFFDD